MFLVTLMRGKITRAIFSLVILSHFHNVVLAQVDPENIGAAQPAADTTVLNTEVFSPVVGLPDRIQEKWNEAHQFLIADDLRAANTALLELNDLRKAGALASMEDASLFLIKRGLAKLEENNIDDAAFYARKALELSPRSARVMFQSLRLVEGTGTKDSFDQFWQGVSLFWSDPALILETAKSLTYPSLWALTLGLYVVFVLFFATQVQTLLRTVARKLPFTLRGLMTPCLTMIMLILPCFLTPLSTLFVWSLVLYLLLPRKRWIGFMTGCVLALWGFVIPLRENLAVWIGDPGVKAMLRVASGNVSKFDRQELDRLTDLRTDDGLAFYTYGQLLRKYGEYQEAENYFRRAERSLGQDQPWTFAQLGMLALLQKDFESAENLFSQAEEKGLDGAAFYFNYSKLHFEQLDTEAAREYEQLAYSEDPALVELLRTKEQEFGTNSNLSLAEIPLPTSYVFTSAFLPIHGVEALIDHRASKLMNGLGTWYMAIGGGLLIFLFFIFTERSGPVRLHTYYNEFEHSGIFRAFVRVVPGGSLAYAGKPVWCFWLVSCCIFMIFPLIQWPNEFAQLFSEVPNFYGYYVSFAAILFAMVLLLSSQLPEEGSK